MKNFCYEYSDGRFLKVEYLGDGEVELTLTKELSISCVFDKGSWALSELFESNSGVYDDGGQYLYGTISESDFTMKEVEIKIK